MLDIIIETERDQHELEYLKKVRGDAGLAYALTQLNGRKPYVSNLAKILMVEIPAHISEQKGQRASLEQVNQQLESIYKIIGRKRNINK